MSELSEDLKIAKASSVDSQGRAVFYSGDNGKNHKRALNSAKEGYVPLDHTEAGRKLDGIYNRNLKRYPRNPVKADRISNRIMTVASRRYARNAHGNVRTYVCGSRPKSVFRKAELPILARNSKITSINGVDRKHFQNAFKQDPSGKKAYRLACLSELRRDLHKAQRLRQKAKQKGDKKSMAEANKAMADYKSRKNRYQNEFSKGKSNNQSKAQSTTPKKQKNPEPVTQSESQSQKRSR